MCGISEFSAVSILSVCMKEQILRIQIPIDFSKILKIVGSYMYERDAHLVLFLRGIVFNMKYWFHVGIISYFIRIKEIYSCGNMSDSYNFCRKCLKKSRNLHNFVYKVTLNETLDKLVKWWNETSTKSIFDKMFLDETS